MKKFFVFCLLAATACFGVFAKPSKPSKKDIQNFISEYRKTRSKEQLTNCDLVTPKIEEYWSDNCKSAYVKPKMKRYDIYRDDFTMSILDEEKVGDKRTYIVEVDETLEAYILRLAILNKNPRPFTFSFIYLLVWENGQFKIEAFKVSDNDADFNYPNCSILASDMHDCLMSVTNNLTREERELQDDIFINNAEIPKEYLEFR